MIFGMILFTFRGIFAKIKIFLKKVVQNYISRRKMNQFCVANRGQKIKRIVLVS